MWTFVQSTGAMLDADGDELGRGYSGNWDGVPPAGGPSDHRNKPADQTRRNIGPIPVGRYTIGPAYDDPHGKGPLVMALTPDPANQMFGRDEFLIHGDRAPPRSGTASDGCIILDRESRRTIARSDDKVLQVLAEQALPIVRAMPRAKNAAASRKAAKPKAKKIARTTSRKPAKSTAKRKTAKAAAKKMPAQRSPSGRTITSKRAAPLVKKGARKVGRRRK